MIDWELLRCFLKVAELGSIERAAQALEVSHSTISRRLLSLEKALGLSLFDRKAREYLLTSGGLRLLQQFGPLGAELEQACSEWGKDAQRPLHLRLSCTDAMANEILPEHLAAFCHTYPDLPISLSVMAEERLVDMLKREADVVLRYCTNPPDYLIGRKVMDAGLFLCASTDYLERRGIPQTLASLSQHQVILGDGRLAKQRDQLWLATHQPESRIRADNYQAISAMCAAGLGVACLPVDTISSKLARLPLTVPFAGELWMLYRPELKNNPFFEVFRTFLLERLHAEKRLCR